MPWEKDGTWKPPPHRRGTYTAKQSQAAEKLEREFSKVSADRPQVQAPVASGAMILQWDYVPGSHLTLRHTAASANYEKFLRTMAEKIKNEGKRDGDQIIKGMLAREFDRRAKGIDDDFTNSR